MVSLEGVSRSISSVYTCGVRAGISSSIGSGYTVGVQTGVSCYINLATHVVYKLVSLVI